MGTAGMAAGKNEQTAENFRAAYGLALGETEGE